MAEHLPPVVAELVAKTDRFRKEMQAAQKSMGAVEKAGGGSFDKLAKVGKAAFLGLGAAAVGFGAIAVKGAMEQEAANARLGTALKNVGSTLTATAKPFEDAQAAARKLGFEDDQATDSLAKLTAATRNPAKALRDLSLAEDVARGRGIDLSAATDILTKVETGHVALLGRIGINTKDATGATISQEEAVRRLSDLYGGQASAFSKTFAGRLATLRAESNELAENVGNFLVPKIEAAAHAGNTASEWLRGNAAASKTLAVVIGGPLVGALGAYAIAQARAAAATLAANTSMLKGAGVVTALAAAYVAGQAIQQKFAAASARTVQQFAGQFADPNERLVQLQRRLKEVSSPEFVRSTQKFQWPWEREKGGIGEQQRQIALLKAQIQATEDAINGESGAAGKAARVHVQMGDAFIEAADDADQLDQKISSIRGSIASNINAQKSYQDTLKRVDEATQSVTDAHRAVDDAISKAVVDTKAVVAAQKDLERSSLGVADAEDRVAAAHDKVAEARKRLADLEKGPAPRDVSEAQLRLAAALRSQDRAAINLHERQKRLKDLQFDSTRTADDFKSAQLDVADAQDGVNQAQIDAANAQDALNALLGTGRRDSDEYKNAQKDLASAEKDLTDTERGLRDAKDEQRDAQDRLNLAQQVDPSLNEAVRTAKDKLADAERGLRDAKNEVAQSSFAAAEAEMAARAEVEKSLPAAMQLRTELDKIGAAYPQAQSYIAALEAMLPPPIPSGPDTILPTISTGGIRRFQSGGLVDAPLGMPVPAIVHGGEEVLTPSQRRRGGATTVVVPVMLDGREIARVMAPYNRDELNRTARRNARPSNF